MGGNGNSQMGIPWEWEYVTKMGMGMGRNRKIINGNGWEWERIKQLLLISNFDVQYIRTIQGTSTEFEQSLAGFRVARSLSNS